MKRGQVTLFIIIGILVVVIASVMIYFTYSANVKHPAEQSRDMKDIFETQVIKDHISSCLYKTVKEGIIKVGMREKNLSRYINENFESCINFEFFKEQGFDVERSDVAASVVVLDDDIIAEMNYSLQATRGEKKTTFGSFQAKFPLVRSQPLDLDVNGLVARDTVIHSTLDDSELRIRKGTTLTLSGEPITSVGIKVIDLSTANSTDYVAHKLLPVGTNAAPSVQFAVSFDDLTYKGEDLLLASFDQIVHRWLYYSTYINSSADEAVANVTVFRAIDLQRFSSACEQFLDTSYDDDTTEYFSQFWNESDIYCASIGGVRDCGSTKECLLSFTFPSDAGSGTGATCCPKKQCNLQLTSCAAMDGIICHEDYLCVDGTYISSTDGGVGKYATCCREGFCADAPHTAGNYKGKIDASKTDINIVCPSNPECILFDDSNPDHPDAPRPGSSEFFCTKGTRFHEDSEGFYGTELYCSELVDEGYGRTPDQRAVWEIGKSNISAGKYSVYVSFDASENRPSKNVKFYIIHEHTVDVFQTTQLWLESGATFPCVVDGVFRPVCYDWSRSKTCLKTGEFYFDGVPSEAVVMDPRDAHEHGSSDVDAVMLCPVS